MSLFDDVKDAADRVVDVVPDVDLPAVPDPSDAAETVVDAIPDVDPPDVPDPSDLSDLLDLSDPPGFDDALGDSDEIVIDLTGENDITTGGDDDLIVTGQGDDLLEGRSGHDDLGGGDGNDTALGGAGNDRLDGGPGADAIDAGDGNDLIVWDALDAGLAGGTGFDILGVGQGDLDLSAAGGAITGIELVDMRGGEASTTVLTASDVLDVSDTDALTVLGDAGDSLAAGPGWTDGGTDVAGLQVFTQDVGGTMATLVVQPDVQTNPDVVA